MWGEKIGEEVSCLVNSVTTFSADSRVGDFGRRQKA